MYVTKNTFLYKVCIFSHYQNKLYFKCTSFLNNTYDTKFACKVPTHFFNKNKNWKFINWKVHLTDGNTSVNEKPSFLGKDWALLYQLLKRFANTKGTTFYPKDTAIQKYSNNNFRKTFVNKLYIIFIINKNDREKYFDTLCNNVVKIIFFTYGKKSYNNNSNTCLDNHKYHLMVCFVDPLRHTFTTIVPDNLSVQILLVIYLYLFMYFALLTSNYA